MLSVWRDIVVFLDASLPGEKVGAHAARLAKKHGAYLVGVYGLTRAAYGSASENFARGSEAIRQVIVRQRSADENKLIRSGRHFARITEAEGVGSEFRVAWQDRLDDQNMVRGLNADLIVAAQPPLGDLPMSWSAEQLLLATGIPVLVVPREWDGGTIGDKVVIAWNGSREARRAVYDAMPFIVTAKQVTILVIENGRAAADYNHEPGADLLSHLAKHDVPATVLVVSSNEPVAHAIVREARGVGANLLVIGAYSHPRSTEILFGGVTRSLLSNTELPMLISR